MILVRIALRNLWLHKFKTLVVGGILLLGTALVVVGNAVLDRLDETTAIAVVNSVSGHAQLYSADAKDEFEIFKGFDSSTRDVGTIQNFRQVRETIEAVPGVRTVVPMGMDYAVVFSGNILDVKLSTLREYLDAGKREEADVVFRHVRRIVDVLREQMSNLHELADMKKVMERGKENFEALENTKDAGFWEGYADKPYDVLEFLENKIAKLALGEDLIWLRYIGTNTETFEKTFDRFEIVEGERIPPGRRGFLFNKLTYERHFKNKTAWRMDMIKERLDNGDLYEECEDCSTWAGQNVRQSASLVYQMDEVASAAVRKGLQAHLKSDESDLVKLLEVFLDVDAGNFAKRYTLFYDVISKHIMLYTVNIGDTLVLTAFGGGYQRKVPVKVYGTFRFKSLDRSPIAGGFNVMDLMTFRDLYGYMTKEKLAEIEAIRKEIGGGEITDDEDDLFGGDEDLVDAEAATSFEATEGLDMTAGGERYTNEIHQRVYTLDEIEDGVVLNAAVMFEDGADFDDTMEAIRAANDEHKLGMNVITWRTAAGMVGKFIDVIRAVLYGAVFVIFIVALVIINNSMMMSTMERTVEIGTMRAIGAQRGFVRSMILLETGVLAVIFGGGGALLGSVAVLIMQNVGVPAWNDITYFIFAGPRFQPTLLPSHLIVAVTAIALVGFGSTFYPAMLATRVTPREAMAAED